MKARVLGGVGLALSVLVAGCQQSEMGEITYSESYIKAPIANNAVTAGYITFVNGKKESVQLTGVSVSSDIAEKTELHGHALRDGLMRMYEVESLDLPPGTPVKLEPGGYHVMLMGLKQSLTPANDVNVTFQFSNGESISVDMPVKASEQVVKGGSYGADGSVNVSEAVTIKNISARATMPGMDTSAAYMTIENKGEKALSLVEVKSPLAKKTELHTTVMENGVMKMRHLSSLDIEAGGEAVLKPGGYHIMLMGLKKSIPEGMEVPVELTFSDGSKASLNVLAMKKIPGQSMVH